MRYFTVSRFKIEAQIDIIIGNDKDSIVSLFLTINAKQNFLFHHVQHNVTLNLWPKSNIKLRMLGK